VAHWELDEMAAQGVTDSCRGEGLVESGPVAVGGGEPVVEVDAVGRDAEFDEPFALGGEVLFVRWSSGRTRSAWAVMVGSVRIAPDK
jgi:hypothetical protein